jgi:hypothetical protein
MSDYPIQFKKGNQWFVDALNKVVSYARGHGVNPAGVPGWSWTVDGWQPPKTKGGGDQSVFPWSISPLGDNVYNVGVGTILKDSSAISDALTCSNPDYEFSPVADGFLTIKVTELAPLDYELAFVSSWPELDGYAITYEGEPGEAGFTFTARHYPLWAFKDVKPDDSWIGTGDGVFGKRVCPPTDFKIVDTLYRTPNNKYFVAPDFDVAHTSVIV